MQYVQHLNRRNLSLATAAGLLGGTALVLGNAFFGHTGSSILLIYAAVLIGIGVILKTNRVESFGDRFAVAFSALAVAGIAHYGFVSFVASGTTGIAGHLWRIGVLALIGVVASAAIARVSE
jgi:hypothetical protein